MNILMVYVIGSRHAVNVMLLQFYGVCRRKGRIEDGICGCAMLVTHQARKGESEYDGRWGPSTDMFQMFLLPMGRVRRRRQTSVDCERSVRLVVAEASNSNPAFPLKCRGHNAPQFAPDQWLIGSCDRFDTQDALYDVSWAEAHENQVVVAAGDGSIKLFDIALDQFPVQSWQEHKREVFAVSWNLVAKDTFCSSSWDGCIKIVRVTSTFRPAQAPLNCFS